MFRGLFMTLCCVFVLSMLCPVTASRAQNVIAGPIINTSNNHAYYLLDTASWTDSEAKANTLGGHLVTINDAAENTWVFNTFVPLLSGSDPIIWIGINDASVEGTFVWASGEPVTYTNWGISQPDNARGEEDYGMMWTPDTNPGTIDGTWNDFADFVVGAQIFGVVEVVPEPGAPVWAGVAALFSAAWMLRRRTNKR